MANDSTLMLFATDAGGVAQFINRACREFFGIPHEVMGLGEWGELVHPDDRESFVGAFVDALRQRRPFRAQARGRRADGSWCWIETYARPRLGPGGELLGMDGSCQDVSERHAAEDLQREGQRRKDEFLAILSHELRNPLAPIRSSLFVLENSPGDGEEARKARQVIARQVTHLTRLIDDLLDVTRISSGKIQLQLERLDLCDLVQHVVDDHAEVFRAAGVTLDVKVCASKWISGDRIRLAQIVGNLLGNAAKFTPAGGRVSVRVLKRDDRALVEVEDTGVGIPPEVLGRVFEPFAQGQQSLDRQKGGLGLGLWLVHELVRQHGGQVAISSEVGQGTSLSLTFPLLPETARGTLTSLPVRRTRSALRILIIEDSEDSAESLKTALELLKHEVQVARDGQEGLELARRFHPHVVLCDLGLPGMTGYQVAQAIGSDQALSGTTLVALSGYAQPEDRARAAASGFTHHVAKPPDLDSLARLLDQTQPHQA